MNEDYAIHLTEQAERIYTRVYEEARACLEVDDGSNSKVTHFRMIEEALEKLIPHDPFSVKKSLSGTFSNVFRIKKGRVRICYIGSSKLKRIIVLYISDTPRKEGHKTDPYRVFHRMVESGQFDPFFESLGLPPPKRKGNPLAQPLQ